MASKQNALMRLFAHDIDGIQPCIVDLERSIKIIGMAVDTDIRRIYRDVPSLGKRFQKYKQTHEIPNKKQPWAFAAVSKGFDKERSTFSYIMGDVVTSLETIPAGLMLFEIPAIKYAIFPVRPKNRFGWGIAIANTKRYAYNVWLPNSGYEPAGVIDDFEYHDERSVRKNNPEIDLYVAIREKH
jgi:predicted transcriptional regulator YdeE